MENNQNTLLITAILIGSLIVGGSLMYLGKQLSDNSNSVDINAAVQAGIEDYIQKQQAGPGTATRKAEKISDSIEDDDAILGSANAAITLVEFSDYECPFCKRHFVQTYPEIKEQYIDTGKVRLIFRDFPLSFHDPLATEQAMAAECVRKQADDETYFAYHDLIFQTTNSNGQGMEKAKLSDVAVQLGIDGSLFTSCLESETFRQEVSRDIADGQQAGISGTPGFLILAKKNDVKIEDLKALEVIQQGQYVNQYIETENGERMGMRVSGAQAFSTFEKIFSLLLN